MTIKASDIRGLIEAGIEGEQLVTVVEIMESKDEVPETTLSNPLPSGGERGGNRLDPKYHRVGEPCGACGKSIRYKRDGRCVTCMRGYAAARFRRKKSPPSQKTPPRNSVFWTTSKEEELKTLFHRGLSDKELAAHFEEKYGRAMTEKAINVRRLILKLKRVRGRKKKLKTSARIAPVQKCPPRYAHGIQGRMN